MPRTTTHTISPRGSNFGATWRAFRQTCCLRGAPWQSRQTDDWSFAEDSAVDSALHRSFVRPSPASQKNIPRRIELPTLRSQPHFEPRESATREKQTRDHISALRTETPRAALVRSVHAPGRAGKRRCAFARPRCHEKNSFSAALRHHRRTPEGRQAEERASCVGSKMRRT